MSAIVITCGDPAGIGPEIVGRWCRDDFDSSLRVAFVGPRDWFDRECLGAIGDLVPVGSSTFRSEPGQPTVEGAKIALEALRIAADGCRSGRFRSAVTGPVSKLWMHRAGFTFPGQTEFFADCWGGEPTMAFAGDRLRVVLATWHIPLGDVPSAITKQAISRAVVNADILVRALGGHAGAARIAVCGLNPHAGEGGLIGSEEMELLSPILDNLRGEYPGLSGCEPADTLFWRHLKGEFDVVVALYHDQGLAPLKAVEFDRAVNITMGLPWVRTSPDHGTGFEIAGCGVADHQSFAHAVSLADRISTSGAFRKG